MILKDLAREGFLGGDLAWDTDAFAAVLMLDSYSYDDAHEFLDDVSGDALWTSSNLTGKTITNGIADAADLVTSALTVGDTIGSLWIFRNTGTPSTSLLVAWYDEDGAGNPIAYPTNGATIALQWNNGPLKLFKI